MQHEDVFALNGNKRAVIGWTKQFNDNSDPTDIIDTGTDMVWYGYIVGYKTAGDALVEKPFEDLDLLVYPIIFNYRQFIELVLKNIYRKNNSVTLFTNWLNAVQHDLKKIWDSPPSSAGGMTVKSIVQSLAQNNPDINVADIEAIIKDFIALDKTSFESRYPITKNNDPVMDDLIADKGQNDQLHINLEAMANNMDYLADMLYYTFDSDSYRIPPKMVE